MQQSPSMSKYYSDRCSQCSFSSLGWLPLRWNLSSSDIFKETNSCKVLHWLLQQTSTKMAVKSHCIGIKQILKPNMEMFTHKKEYSILWCWRAVTHSNTPLLLHLCKSQSHQTALYKMISQDKNEPTPSASKSACLFTFKAHIMSIILGLEDISLDHKVCGLWQFLNCQQRQCPELSTLPAVPGVICQQARRKSQKQVPPSPQSNAPLTRPHKEPKGKAKWHARAQESLHSLNMPDIAS